MGAISLTASCEVTVPCGGDHHRVSLERGRLRFHAHRVVDLEDEVALAVLGGRAQGCAEILRVWRSARGGPGAGEGEVGADLPGALGRARLLTLARTRHRRWHHRDPLDSPPAGWDEATLVAEAATSAARVTASAADMTLTRVRVAIGPPRCSIRADAAEGLVRPAGGGELARFVLERERLVVDLTVPPTWADEVWGPGRERDGPRLVLAAAGDHLVVVDWQRGGIDIRPAV